MQKLLIIPAVSLLFNPLFADQISVVINETAQMDTDTGGYLYLGEKATWGQAGDPALPVEHIQLLLPPDVTEKSIQINLCNEQYDQKTFALLAPLPPNRIRISFTVKDLWPRSQDIEDGRNIRIYNSNVFYPANPIMDYSVGQIRGWKILTVTVALLKYNPVLQQVQRLRSGMLTVDYSRKHTGQSITQEMGQTKISGQEWIKPLVQNYEEMSGEYLDPGAQLATTGQVRGYALITTYKTAVSSMVLRDFVHSKNQRGFRCYIVTEYDWGGGKGDTAAENIRRWLQSNYLGLNIEYVLLIGNPNPQNGDIPMKLLLKPDFTEDGHFPAIPSDIYYSDLTGNWDLDKDGFFGEREDDVGPGGIDLNADVLVGRIPHYGDINILDKILKKSIFYENEQNPAWRCNTLLAMDSLDSSTPGYDLGEAIKDSILAPAALDCYRIYTKLPKTSQPAEKTPCSYENVYSAWSTSPFGLVVWSAHGKTNIATNVLTMDYAAGLPDIYPAICFQNSCFNANPYSEDNLAFQVLKTGAIATISATDIATYMPGPFIPEFKNSRSMAFEFVRQVMRERKDTAHALDDIRRYYNYRYRFRDVLSHVIYGDPSLGLYTCKIRPNIAVFKDQVQIYHNDEIDLGELERGSAKKITFRLYNHNAASLVLEGRAPVKTSDNARLAYKAVDKIPPGQYTSFDILFDIRYPQEYRITVSVSDYVQFSPTLSFAILARGVSSSQPDPAKKFWGVFSTGDEKGFNFWTGSVKVGTSEPWLITLKETIDDSALSSCWIKAEEYAPDVTTFSGARKGEIIFEITDSGFKRRFQHVRVSQAPFYPVPIGTSEKKAFMYWPEQVAARCSMIEIKQSLRHGDGLNKRFCIKVSDDEQIFDEFCQLVGNSDSSAVFTIVEHHPDGTAREYAPFRIQRNGIFKNDGKWLVVKPNYPNPFKTSTNIPYILKRPAIVNIEIFNLKGQRVRRLRNEGHEPGYYQAAWDGVDDNGKVSASGTFFCVFQSNSYRTVHKVTFIK
ncbi:hypothetical protein JW935_16700 [candidate division KSB1 bacterium]|nr:hypothetical protein [candidate division KSB1 bacterium]